MQTTKFLIPESITINGRTIFFHDMLTVVQINEYLDMIEKLQVYDPNVVFGKRQ